MVSEHLLKLSLRRGCVVDRLGAVAIMPTLHCSWFPEAQVMATPGMKVAPRSIKKGNFDRILKNYSCVLQSRCMIDSNFPF